MRYNNLIQHSFSLFQKTTRLQIECISYLLLSPLAVIAAYFLCLLFKSIILLYTQLTIILLSNTLDIPFYLCKSPQKAINPFVGHKQAVCSTYCPLCSASSIALFLHFTQNHSYFQGSGRVWNHSFIQILIYNYNPHITPSKYLEAMNAELKNGGGKSEIKRKYGQLARSKSSSKSQGKQKKQRIVYMRISDEDEGVSIPFSLWSDSVKKIIKQKGGIWCPVFKIWKLSRVQMEFVRRDLTSLFSENYETPPYFIDMIASGSKELTIHRQKLIKKQYSIESHPLFDKLYPFQRDTLAFCLAHHGRILIADEMGVGKSVQSLACSLMFLESFPILIICPSALKYVWKDEVGKWLKGVIKAEEVVIIKKSSLTQNQTKYAKVIIASYEIASKLTREFEKIQMVICDEAHYLKNPDTNRCELLVPFLSQKKRVFLLTGTPALAKPRELFNLLKILRCDVFKSFEHFGDRYCERRQNPWTFKWEFDGARNLAELHYILKKTVMIRRLKQDVLPQLPPKQRQIIFMQTQKSVIGQIKELLGSSISIENIRSSEKIMHLFAQKSEERDTSSIMRCYLLSGLSKLQSVKEYITSILQNDVKVVIFAHHKVIMDDLDNHLKSLKIQYIRLDGQSSPETRKRKIDHFQDQFNIRAALLSITAMGTGFTLTAASTVLFAQLHWTPAILLQAQDRTHRIGQKHSVNIHYLIGDKTLDPLMLRQLERKVDTVGRVLDATTDSLNMQVLEKGEIGNFEVVQYEEKRAKGEKKITDYFTSHSKNDKRSSFSIGKLNEQSPMELEKTLVKDENEEKLRKNSEKIMQQSSQSEDSIILEFVRRKRLEIQTQTQGIH